MFRTLFVLTIVTIGTYYALQAPFFALLLYIWNAYFRPEDWVWSDLIRSLHLSYIVGCYVVLATLFSGKRFLINGRLSLIIFFLLHTLLSTLLSEHFEYSLFYWLEFLKLIIITYLLILLIDDFSKFRLMLLVIALSLGLEAAKQGWFHLLTSPGGANPNPIAFLGDNNGVAVGMLMLVPIIALLAQTTPRKWARLFYWVILIGVLYRALSTFSRGAFLASIAMGSAYFLYSQKKLRMLFASTIIVAIVITVLPDAFWTRMKTIQTYEEDQDGSALGRLHFWHVVLEMAAAHPILGVGYNGYNPSYDDYDFSHGKYGHRRAVHNSFLAVLAELGYVGLAIYAIIILSSFQACHKVRKLAATSPSLLHFRQTADALSTSLIVFLVGGFFVTFQYQEMLWHLFGLAIVLVEIGLRHNSALVLSKV
jgi:probable O-glycosylation ligase (exosortase A-associated)